MSKALESVSPPAAPAPVSVPRAAWQTLRPQQWTKNTLLYAALLFSGQLLVPLDLLSATLGFMAFCLASSAGYVLNDLLDREADRRHPTKRFRPFAAGAVPVSLGPALIGGCLLGAGLLAWWLPPSFALVMVAYLATTLAYTLYFKHQVILDVMALGACFVWRAVAGAAAIGVAVSPWLFLCTAFLALFLGFNKRKAELSLGGVRLGIRRNLAEYSPQMLDQFQAIVTGSTVLCYALYTVLGPTPWMILTIPPVLYGIFRYIYLVDQQGEGGAPDETLLRDRPLQVAIAVYVVTAAVVLMGSSQGWLPDG